MQTGLPTTTVLPFSNVDKNPDEIELSNNATVPTRFVFDSPVYLEGRTEYCVVFLSNSTEYKVAISRMGEVDLRFRDDFLENESELTLNQLLDLSSNHKTHLLGLQVNMKT